MFPWNIFPFNKDAKNMMQHMKPEEIEKHVQNMLGKMFPANMGGMFNPQDMMNGSFSNKVQPQSSGSTIGATVFETHDYVYVRVLVKDEEWMKQMKLYYTSNQMIIEHVPEWDDKHTIVLPAIVKRKGASARFKDEMLEVKIPKNTDLQFSEIDVTEIM